MNNIIRRMSSFLIMFLVLYGLMLASILLPDREYSTTENKFLSSFPSLSFKSLTNGTFEERYDTYVSDQIPGRDIWIAVKSLAETALLRTENNSVIYGSDGYLFQKYLSFSREDLEENISALNAFASKASAPVYVTAVPSAYAVLSDKLPEGVPFADQRSVISGELGGLLKGCTYIDILQPLDRHSSQYIYYRTDHHWTTDGAWIAYNAICAHLGLESFIREDKNAHEADGFLGTSYSRSRRSGQQSDTILYYTVDAVLTADGVQHSSVYDFTKLYKRDKYAMFLYGNGAERVLESPQAAGKKHSLLVIKDSYADCMVPFFTSNYETVTCIDPRYYSGSFAALASGEWDDILILFGFEDLAGEPSILKLGF